MSPEEQLALERMKATQLRVKLECYEVMAMLADPATNLVHCGYRDGLGDALTRVLADSAKKLRALEAAHIKRFPDR